MIKRSPEEKFQSVIEKLSGLDADPSNKEFAQLACGTLEALLAACGGSLIELVEAEAQVNQKFRVLLGGVWQNSMPPDVWVRVQKLQDFTGWKNNA